MATNRYRVAALDSALYLVAISWLSAHVRGGTLDFLLLIDVTHLIRVTVVAPIGSSVYSSLSAVISMAEAYPKLCVSL